MKSNKGYVMDKNDNTGEEEKAILDPEELRIENKDEVTKIDDNRYVVASSGSPNSDGIMEDKVNQEDHTEDTTDQTANSADLEEAVKIIEKENDSRDEMYSIILVGNFDGEKKRATLTENNIMSLFEKMILWISNQSEDDNLSPREIAEILWEKSDRLGKK